MSHIQCAPERMYRARWLGADGREPSRTFTRKAEAERHLATVEVAKLPGVYTSNANPVTMGEYTRRWAGTGPHRPIRATRLASLINKHILRRDRFHAARCRTILTGAGLGSATDPKFSHLALRGFRWRICGSIFAAAVQDRLVASNPMMRPSMPRSERERMSGCLWRGCRLGSGNATPE
jgi:hypothetical protein